MGRHTNSRKKKGGGSGSNGQITHADQRSRRLAESREESEDRRTRDDHLFNVPSMTATRKDKQ